MLPICATAILFFGGQANNLTPMFIIAPFSHVIQSHPQCTARCRDSMALYAVAAAGAGGAGRGFWCTAWGCAARGCPHLQKEFGAVGRCRKEWNTDRTYCRLLSYLLVDLMLTLILYSNPEKKLDWILYKVRTKLIYLMENDWNRNINRMILKLC